MKRIRIAEFVGIGAYVLMVILVKALFFSGNPESDFDLSLFILEGVLITAGLPFLGMLEVRLEKMAFTENWLKVRIFGGIILCIILLLVGIQFLLAFFRMEEPTAQMGFYVLLIPSWAWTFFLTFFELQKGPDSGDGDSGDPLPDWNPPENPGNSSFR